MTRTFADMTPAERDDYVGMWCEDPDGDLVILDRVHESRVDGQVVVVVFHPPSGDRLRYLASELTPRLDLRRAWPPDGKPLPLPEPEMDMADPHLAVWESGVTMHHKVVYVPHFLPLDDMGLVEQTGMDLLAAAAYVLRQKEKEETNE